MNRFNYILYTIIIGLLGSGLTAQAMRRGASKLLSPVIQNASILTKNSNFVHLAKDFGTEVGKEAYQQVGKRAARGGAHALFTGINHKKHSLSQNKSREKPFKTSKNQPFSVDPVTGKVSFNRDSQPSKAKEQTQLADNIAKDHVEEKKEQEITGSNKQSESITTNFNIAEVVSRAFSSKTEQAANAKKIVSAGKAGATSKGALQVDAKKIEQKAKETKEEKQAKKLEEKKRKNSEKAVERRKKDDVTFNAKREKLENKLSEDFQKQMQLRKDQEARAQQKLEVDTRVPEVKGQDLAPTPLRNNMFEQPVESKGLSTIPTPKNINVRYPLNTAGKANTVGVRQTLMVQPTPSAKSPKPANVRKLKQSPVSLIKIEKLLTNEVVVDITTDNPVARLKELDAIYGDALNNQLATRNNAKNQLLMLEQTSRGNVKRAVLLVQTQQLKNILGRLGVRFNGKKPTQIIISPTQAKTALDALTQPKQPALPEAQGKDIVPVAPRNNNKIIDIPVAGEKAQGLSVVPKNTTIPGRTMGSAGKADIGIHNATLSVRPTPITRALVPVTKSTRALVPKTIQPKRNTLVVAETARAKVGNTGLKVKAEKIEIPEQKRFEREEEMARERDRLDREREEREMRERDKEREEEYKEQERLERERREREEQQRRDEELRRDREREEEQKEISKRNKRLRRGPKQRVDRANDDNAAELMRARRVENNRARDLTNAGPAAAVAVNSIVMPAQPVPATAPPAELESPFVPRRDPRIDDYRKIIATARRSVEDIIENNVHMKIKWAHRDQGIERMLLTFNASINTMAHCKYNDHRYSAEALATSALCFESVKKQIIEDMLQALAELDSGEQDTSLLVFHG